MATWTPDEIFQDNEEEEVVDTTINESSPTIDEILFPVNTELIDITSNTPVDLLDEDGKKIEVLDDVIDPEDTELLDLRWAMEKRETLAQKDDSYINFRKDFAESLTKTVNETPSVITKIGPTINDYNSRISVLDPKYDYYKDYYSEIDEDLKEGKYGPQWAGLGLVNKFDTNHLENELININNDAGILVYNGVNETPTEVFSLRKDQTIITAQDLVGKKQFSLTSPLFPGKPGFDKVLSGTHVYNIVTGELEELEVPIPPEGKPEKPFYLTPEFINNLTEEELTNFELDDGARAYMISRLLEDEPEGSNLRDVMEKHKDFEGFMNFASSKFSNIIGSDPYLNAWASFAKQKIFNTHIQKKQELEDKIINPCAKENDGVATEDCILLFNTEMAEWENTQFNKLYNQNKYVQNMQAQYAIGFSKLMQSLQQPYGRDQVQTWREINDVIQADGISATVLANDAWKKLGYSVEQTSIYAKILYNRSGTRGDVTRGKMLDLYNMPWVQDFIKEAGIFDLPVDAFREGYGADQSLGRSNTGNTWSIPERQKLTFDAAQPYILENGTFRKDPYLPSLRQRDIISSFRGDKSKPNFDLIPSDAGQAYALHIGTGALQDREGTIEITKENYQDYFGYDKVLSEDEIREKSKSKYVNGKKVKPERFTLEGPYLEPIIAALNEGKKVYFTPVQRQEFSAIQSLVRYFDKWAVGGKSGSWVNGTPWAKIYGGTGWKYGDLTIRQIVDGVDNQGNISKDVESILATDLRATAELFKNTTDMMTAEYNSGLALDPKTEFSDVTTLMRHLVGQADTMVPMYVGGLLDMTGKIVEKGGPKGKVVGLGLRGIGKGMSFLGTLNIIAKEFTSNTVETLRQVVMQDNGGKAPTAEEFIALFESDDIDEIIMKSLAGAAAQGGLEKLGVDATLFGLRNPGGALIASLYRKEFKKFLKSIPKTTLNTMLSAGGEGITEGLQGWVHDMTVNWGLGLGFAESWGKSKFDMEGFNVGWRIGLALPVPAAVMQQSAIEIQQVGYDIASKLVMDPATSNNIFSSWAATNNFYSEAINEIKNRQKNNQMSDLEARASIDYLSTLRNSGTKIPKTMQGKQRSQYLDLLLEQKRLQDKIEETNNKQISEGNGDTAALTEVNNQIVEMTKTELLKQEYFKKVGNVDKIIEKSTDGKVRIFKEKDTDAVNNRTDQLKDEGFRVKKQSKDNADYGTIYQKGDQQVIILNEAEIVKDGTINTAAHEFLHAVIYQTVKNSKGTAVELGNNLLQYIKDINPELLKKGEFKDRYEQYKNAEDVTDAVMGEEILTLFSEAVLDGAIEIKEGLTDTFKNIIRRIFQTFAPNSLGKIEFNTGKDVYNFIKDYNKSIEKGKLTAAQEGLLQGRATGDLIKRRYKRKSIDTSATPSFVNREPTPDTEESIKKSSKKLTELTKKYKEGNFDNVEDLSIQYQRTGKDALKRWAAQRGVTINLGNPQVDKEVTSLLNKEFNSFTRNFDQTKSEASTYMNQIAKRIGPKIVEEATRKTKQVSTDVLNEKGFSPETTTQPDLDVKTQPTGKRAKVFPNKIKTISDKITGETRADQIIMLKNDIIEGILRVGAKPKAIAKYIVEKTKTKEYRKLIKDKLGVFGSKQYIDTVNSLFANTDFISAIPIANIKRRFGKLFGISKTGTIPTVKIEDGKETRYDKGVYNVPAISNSKLARVRNYFLAADGEKRSQSLFSIVGEGLAVEAIQELSTDPQFMKELENRLNFKNSNLNATQFLAELEFDLDKRNLEDTSLDVVKASKKRPQRSYSEVGLQEIARSTMRQVGGQSSVFNYKNIKDSQKSTRRTGSIIMIHGFGKDTQGSYNYGKKESIYRNEAEFNKDVFNTPLTEAEITLLEKFDIPLVTRRGKTYYDKSKAKNSFELGIDEQIMVKGKQKSVLQLARTEQKDYRKLTGPEARARLNNKEFDELQKAKLRVFKKLAKRIESDLKIDPALKNYWAAWLNQSNDNILHPVRSLAPVDFFETRKGNKVAEHTFPASQVATIVMNMAIEGKVDENFEFIEKDYFQGSILKTDDAMLKGEGYNYISNMPNIFFDIKNPTTWMRYVDTMVNNSKSGGININNIVVKKNGKVMTLAESFNLPLTKKAIPGLIRYQNNLLYDVFRGAMTINEAQVRLKVAENTGIKVAENIQVEYNGNILAPGVLPTDSTPEYSKQVQQNSLETRVNAFKPSKKRKGISVFDFDDTLAKTKEKVIVIMPDGTRKKISASQFAIKAESLKERGAEFDFSNFEKVSKSTAEGPLADLARKRQGKFGSGDIFVLTARPQISALSIKEFLDGIGINIPLENITGLADGSPQAKVDWMLNKTAEGYNDFYFADDSLANVVSVKNILDAVDVKNEVYQAKSSKKRNLNTEFNEMLEYATGKEAFKTYSNARARLEGAKKDGGLFKRFLRQFQITASAEDFLGLMYAFVGKGEQGSTNLKWIYDNVYSLYSKAEQELLSARVSVANDFAALRAKFPTLKGKKFSFKNPLLQSIGVGPYNKSQAVRVYLWNKQGMEIPGMSKTDIKKLVKAVESDPELNVFADELQLVNKTQTYPKPDANWLAGTIKDDVLRGIDTEFRSQLMAEFDANVKTIFSSENMNKIQALFGTKFREALEDSLRRMKSGSNRPIYIGGGSRIVNEMLDYMNASVGVTMFLNMRSGLLQMISNVNFINWGDNNIYNAAKAFANQKQYWTDVLYLMNSDYLVNRRDGLKINVNEAELVDAGRKGGFKGVLSYLLDKGFIITRTVDSLAIATGGASFYRNRVKTYVKQGMTQQEAEAQAFDDFYNVAEESQQSSNPARISQQQASLAGRFILSFQNVTMQYTRVTKKAVLDLYNRRKRPGQTQREADLSNISKIVYYTTMQNLLFNGLQNTLFSALFEDEELEDSQIASTANGMLDSLLFGLGFGGAIISTVKNVLMVIADENEKKSPDYEEAVWELFNISPVLDIKVRKYRTAAKTFKWNKKEIARRGWNIDNPAYLAVAQMVSATFNTPVDRLLRKMMNVAQALDSEVETWQRVALFMGWTGWNLDLPYWGRQSTIEREAAEDAKLEEDYKKEFGRLKREGYRRRPMTKGKPKGKVGIDYIEVKRPNGKIEYWLTPNNTN